MPHWHFTIKSVQQGKFSDGVQSDLLETKCHNGRSETEDIAVGRCLVVCHNVSGTFRGWMFRQATIEHILIFLPRPFWSMLHIELSEETVLWLVTFWFGSGLRSDIYTFLPRSQVTEQESSIYYQVLLSVFAGQLFQDLEDRRAKTGQRVIPIEDNMTRRSEYDGVTEGTEQLGKGSLVQDSWTGHLEQGNRDRTERTGRPDVFRVECLNAFKFLWS
jgi:hypothetical protein